MSATDTIKPTPQRVVFGEALVELGRTDERVVVLDADVSSSTQTRLFAAAHPGRFFNFGIAEANMVSAAAGLASCGYVPFVSTFALFISLRAGDQVRAQVAYTRANVKLVGGYAGLSDFADGASHQSVEDIAVMRAIPNITIISPCDIAQTRAAVRAAAEFDGPVYLRISRAEVGEIPSGGMLPSSEACDSRHGTPGGAPTRASRERERADDIAVAREPERERGKDVAVTAEDAGETPAIPPFQIGRSRVLRDGRDVTIIAAGPIVASAMHAAQRLAGEGVSVRVIDMHTIKPLDAEQVERAAAETGAIVTVEEHSIYGGLGSAVCEAVCAARPVPVIRVGIPDRFGESGAYPEILRRAGLDEAAIVAAAKRAIAVRK